MRQNFWIYLRTCAVLMLLTTSLLLFLSVYYSNKPYSKFTDWKKVRDMHYAHRFAQLPEEQDKQEELFERYFPPNSNSVANFGQKTFCIAITSVHRNSSYLPKTLLSLMMSLNEEERNDIHIIVNNVDIKPERHVTAKFVSRWVEVVSISEGSLFELPKEAEPKQTLDYAMTLRTCTNKSRFTIVMEDDVAASRGWFGKLKVYMEELSSRKDYAHVRLFETQAWESWQHFNLDFRIRNPIIFCVVTFLCVRYLFRVRWLLSAIVGIWAGLMLVLSIETIGKQNVCKYSLKPGLNEWATCCSQAILYPNWIVTNISDYLIQNAHNKERGWADFKLNDFAYREGLKMFVLVPSLFQHMGMVSVALPGTDRSEYYSYTFVE